MNTRNRNYLRLLNYSKENGGLWRNSKPTISELIRNNIQMQNVNFVIELCEIYGFSKAREMILSEFDSFDTTNTDMKNRFLKTMNFINTYNEIISKGGDFLTEKYKKGLSEFLTDSGMKKIEEIKNSLPKRAK